MALATSSFSRLVSAAPSRPTTSSQNAELSSERRAAWRGEGGVRVGRRGELGASSQQGAADLVSTFEKTLQCEVGACNEAQGV